MCEDLIRKCDYLMTAVKPPVSVSQNESMSPKVSCFFFQIWAAYIVMSIHLYQYKLAVMA